MLADDFIALPVAFAKGSRPRDVPGWGRPFVEWLRHAYPRYVTAIGPVQEIPHPESRVTLDPWVRDAFDRPVARLSGTVHPETLRTAQAMNARGAEWLRAAGCERVWTVDDTLRMSAGQHQAGTCRMGDDPRLSVVDANGKVHGIGGLYVADGFGPRDERRFQPYVDDHGARLAHGGRHSVVPRGVSCGMETLEERVARLERANRRLSALGALGIATGFAFGFGGGADVVRARRFEVVDAKGVPLAILAPARGDLGGELVLRDAAGERRVAVTAEAGGSVAPASGRTRGRSFRNGRPPCRRLRSGAGDRRGAGERERVGAQGATSPLSRRCERKGEFRRPLAKLAVGRITAY